MTLTRLFAVFFAAQLAFSPLMAQMPATSTERDYSIGPDTWPNIFHAFQMPDVPYVEEGNSPRLDELIHDGKLYLSPSDAIALALENNLDVAVSRFSRKIAETQFLRAKTGGAVTGAQGRRQRRLDRGLFGCYERRRGPGDRFRSSGNRWKGHGRRRRLGRFRGTQPRSRPFGAPHAAPRQRPDFQ